VVLVKTDDGRVTENDFSSEENGLKDNYQGYILVDCVDGICKQTGGYIKSITSGTSGRKRNNQPIIILYAFYENDKTKKAESSTYKSNVENKNDCTDRMIGQLLNDNNSICIENNINVSFGKGNERYIILSSKHAIADVPFKDTTNNIILKHGEEYIINDLFFNSK